MAQVKGFTLYELLITLALIAITLTLGIPNLSQFIQNSRTTAQANERIAALNLARSEALKRGDEVAVVPEGGDWTADWQVGVDANSDGDFTDDGEELLRVVPGVAPASLAAVDFDGDPLPRIAFESNGWVRQSATLTLVAHQCSVKNRREISLNRAGTVSITRQDCP